MRRLACHGALCAPLFILAPAHAHDSLAPDGASAGWTWDPLTLWPIGVCLVLLFVGIARARLDGRSGLIEPWRVVSFLLGLMALFIALASPLDALAGEFFSVHMGQHLLIMLVAPPLLVLGRPLGLWLRAFPAPARRRFAHRWSTWPVWRTCTGALLQPGVVWVAASAALWFWHMPRPYAWALENPGVHAAEHLSFLVTNLAFWWLVLDPGGQRRLSAGGALLYAATYGLENGMLGAVLTFAMRPLYPPHANHPGVLGLSALQDQQLAGVLMWVPAGIVYVMALAVMFVSWLHLSEKSESNKGNRRRLVVD